MMKRIIEYVNESDWREWEHTVPKNCKISVAGDTNFNAADLEMCKFGEDGWTIFRDSSIDGFTIVCGTVEWKPVEDT